MKAESNQSHHEIVLVHVSLKMFDRTGLKNDRKNESKKVGENVHV